MDRPIGNQITNRYAKRKMVEYENSSRRSTGRGSQTSTLQPPATPSSTLQQPNLSYSAPIFETSATALCGATGNLEEVVGTPTSPCRCQLYKFNVPFSGSHTDLHIGITGPGSQHGHSKCMKNWNTFIVRYLTQFDFLKPSDTVPDPIWIIWDGTWSNVKCDFLFNPESSLGFLRPFNILNIGPKMPHSEDPFQHCIISNVQTTTGHCWMAGHPVGRETGRTGGMKSWRAHAVGEPKQCQQRSPLSS